MLLNEVLAKQPISIFDELKRQHGSNVVWFDERSGIGSYVFNMADELDIEDSDMAESLTDDNFTPKMDRGDGIVNAILVKQLTALNERQLAFLRRFTGSNRYTDEKDRLKSNTPKPQFIQNMSKEQQMNTFTTYGRNADFIKNFSRKK